jgi:1,4-alpha-glucan branching enzyme
MVLAIFIAGGFVYRQTAGYLQPPPSTTLNGQGVPVVFHLKDPSATTVAVMGSFNQWDPKGYEMTRDPDTGSWTLLVRLAPGRHEYVFWVDNQRTASDPNADLIREDDFGSENSVLFVKGNHGQSI